LPSHCDKHFGFGRAARPQRQGSRHALRPRVDAPNREGKHYGVITAKALAVLELLLWSFHNAATGRCFPSYESIAERAACSRTIVYQAIRLRERAGILTWCNRLARICQRCVFGPLSAWRGRIVRTSNAYAFTDPASKFKFQTGHGGAV
jgi:hypothetical protein